MLWQQLEKTQYFLLYQSYIYISHSFLNFVWQFISHLFQCSKTAYEPNLYTSLMTTFKYTHKTPPLFLIVTLIILTLKNFKLPTHFTRFILPSELFSLYWILFLYQLHVRFVFTQDKNAMCFYNSFVSLVATNQNFSTCIHMILLCDVA